MNVPTLTFDGDAPQWPAAVAHAGPWTVLADATLYYRSDLVRRCGAGTPSDDAATLIARALERGGDAAVAWLEGDYAFVAWHGPERRLLAARDVGGKAALHYAWHEGRLHLASDEGRLLADAALPRTLDLTTLCTVAAGMWSHSDRTVYTAIRELPAGACLHWTPGGEPTVQRHWQPPDEAAHRASLDAAAAELRTLLDDAVRERVDPEGRTAVTLSGGWDSSAIYATAQAIGAHPLSVSISYPAGDPGREDELIGDIAAFWNATPDFLDVNRIPLSHDWLGEAARRGGPFAHAYEHWNRALSRRASALGARVILDGVGGDQLFQSSEIYLAELLRRGQLLQLLRETRARSGPRSFVRTLYPWAIRPNLPTGLATAVARMRGLPPPRHYLDRLPAPWFRRSFLRGHGVMERERATRPVPTARDHVLAEGQMYFSLQFYPRIFAQLARFARDEGVALRSPLMDTRIIRFALGRPWSDRVRGAETKRSLRLAMRGRLPDSVLAPRAHRTGTTNAYFLRELRRAAWPIAESLLSSMRLVEIGMVEPTRYRRAWDHVLQHADDEIAARLFFTLQAELWLRTHLA